MAKGWVSFEGLVCFRGSLDSGRVSTPAVDCRCALLLPVGTGDPLPSSARPQGLQSRCVNRTG